MTRTMRTYTPCLGSHHKCRFLKYSVATCRLRQIDENLSGVAVRARAPEAPNSVTKRHHRPGGGVRYPPLGSATQSSPGALALRPNRGSARQGFARYAGVQHRSE